MVQVYADLPEIVFTEAEQRCTWRLLCSTKLLNKLKHPKENNMIWFFSYEIISARIKCTTDGSLPAS